MIDCTALVTREAAHSEEALVRGIRDSLRRADVYRDVDRRRLLRFRFAPRIRDLEGTKL